MQRLVLPQLFKTIANSIPLSPEGEVNSDGYTAISRKAVRKKVHATIPKGIVGSFEFTFLQRNLNKWHERPLEYLCES